VREIRLCSPSSKTEQESRIIPGEKIRTQKRCNDITTISRIKIYRFLRKREASPPPPLNRPISQAVSLRGLSTKERTLEERRWCAQAGRSACYATRNYRETQKRAPPRRRGRRRRDRARTQGHRILICSRFALLIRQRCMLMRLTPYARRVLYFQMSDGRRTAGVRRRSRGLNVGYEKESHHLSSLIRIPRLYSARSPVRRNSNWENRRISRSVVGVC